MTYREIQKCFITDLPITPLNSRLFPYEYSIQLNGNKTQSMFFQETFFDFANSDEFKAIKHIFAGALINGNLLEKPNPIPLIKANILMSKFKSLVYPSTPKEKLDNLFKTIVLMQNYEGEKLDFKGKVSNPLFYYGHYFKTKQECNYYLKVLQQLDYIDAEFNSISNDRYGALINATITFAGLNYYNDITENGKFSNKCFIAMSFNPKLEEIRQAIREAVEFTNHKPILVDEVHYDSDKTINDAIIANLKMCKFCIADFTEQKHGVYLECGYAIGQGKPVIYTCSKNDFINSHFDTNHFPHIIYENPSELKQKLIDKILAWIN